MSETQPDAAEVLIELPERVTVGEALLIAINRHRIEALDAAERIYRAVLAVAPEQPDALHFLGVLEHQRGETAAGIELIERAIGLAPELVDAYSNLGNILKDDGQLEGARRAYERVLEQQPEHVAALNNIGVVLKDLGESDAAIAALTRAHELAPDEADILQNLGNAFGATKRFNEATGCYRKAIALRPYFPEAYRALSTTVYALDDAEEARRLVRQWLEFDKDNPVALHLLAAFSGAEAPGRASDGYVREVFDNFASSFDGVLKNLGYRAPELVQAAFLAALPEGAGGLSILDAGCGTGLCGPLLRPVARRLAGVDLSGKMLQRAAARKVYDELEQAELTAFLASKEGAYDAIVSADTLCYFGDLRPVFEAAHRALRPDGSFVFTVEAMDGEQAGGHRIRPHGRYTHARAYVEAELIRAGFVVRSVTTGDLRRERGDQVSGWIVVAAR